MNGKRLLMALTLGASVGLIAMMPTARADTGIGFGAGATASAKLDFRVIIPRFLLFRVGSVGTTVDLVDFDFVGTPPAALGDSTPLAATTGGAVPVTLTTNITGVISVGASTGGPLTNGGTGTINFTEILTATGGTIGAPALANGASTAVVVGVTPGTLTDTWTYSYANTTVPEEGTYGGAGVGTVTYTATLP